MGHADGVQPADEQPQRVGMAERLACIPDLVRTAWRHARVASLVGEHEARMRP